ncbi:hypothetical protein PoB_007504500 [Plakobranchus ocellatus]|uniref:Uncharacterized protein n=1 Tax=Plakobranchus ocellatus TaxID=259542 RepID=A0AAV4DWW7_9GAST|nr:hypothetical protein PoB_007504500 [Plakobranchus ocellatus]
MLYRQGRLWLACKEGGDIRVLSFIEKGLSEIGVELDGALAIGKNGDAKLIDHLWESVDPPGAPRQGAGNEMEEEPHPGPETPQSTRCPSDTGAGDSSWKG